MFNMFSNEFNLVPRLLGCSWGNIRSKDASCDLGVFWDERYQPRSKDPGCVG